MQEIKGFKNLKERADEKKFKIDFDFQNDKYIIYSAVFYTCGLILGSSFYEAASSDTLNKILMPQSATLLNLFLSNMCLYLSIFMIIIFLGLCLIGYPIMNLIPAFLGFEYGMKISYFLINYSTKGVGYVILMIVPFYALFSTIIIYTLKESAKMSMTLSEMTKKGSGAEFSIKPYLISYAILGVIIIVASLFSAGMTTLLFNVVTI